MGAASQSASGQLARPEAFIQGSDDMVAYGSRSRFVTSNGFLTAEDTPLTHLGLIST